jgi:hypothetical protein
MQVLCSDVSPGNMIQLNCTIFQMTIVSFRSTEHEVQTGEKSAKGFVMGADVPDLVPVPAPLVCT